MEQVIFRIRQRINDETVTEQTLSEIAQTINDRVCLRLGVDEAPKIFESIIVDACVKLYRRMYYEGISSEGDDGLSVTFVEDVLNEYTAEFEQYKLNQRTSTDVLKFI